MLVFVLRDWRTGGVGCEGFEQGSRTGAGLGDLFDTDTVSRIGLEVGELNIPKSVDGRDGVVQVMDDPRCCRDGRPCRRGLPGSRQGAFNRQVKGVRSDVGNIGCFMGPGAEGMEQKGLVRCDPIGKECAVRGGEAQGLDRVAYAMI